MRNDKDKTHNALVADWKENAEKRDEKNYLFLRSLKMRSFKKVDRIALKLHQEAFNIVDCTKCANCCRTDSGPSVLRRRTETTRSVALRDGGGQFANISTTTCRCEKFGSLICYTSSERGDHRCRIATTGNESAFLFGAGRGVACGSTPSCCHDGTRPRDSRRRPQERGGPN